MRSLEVASTNAARQPAPRAAVAPRAKSRATSRRPRYASSVEEAKAAAEAAAAATTKQFATAAAAAATASAATDAAGPAITSDGLATSSEHTAVAVQTLPCRPDANPSGISLGTAVSGETLGSRAAVEGPLASSDTDPVPEGGPLPPTPPRVAVAGQPAVPPTNDGPEGSAAGAGESDAARGDAGDADLDNANPFVGSQKLARIPPPPPPVANAAVVRQTTTAAAAAPAPILPAAGTDNIEDADVQAGTQPEAATAPLAVAVAMAAPEASESPDAGRGGQESPEAACGNPFASRSNIPRTPTDQVAPLPESGHHDGPAGGEGGDAEPAYAGEAQLRIGELRQELASMADRLAKQADERKR